MDCGIEEAAGRSLGYHGIPQWPDTSASPHRVSTAPESYQASWWCSGISRASDGLKRPYVVCGLYSRAGVNLIGSILSACSDAQIPPSMNQVVSDRRDWHPDISIRQLLAAITRHPDTTADGAQDAGDNSLLKRKTLHGYIDFTKPGHPDATRDDTSRRRRQIASEDVCSRQDIECLESIDYSAPS